jgi:hypothetical protein
MREWIYNNSVNERSFLSIRLQTLSRFGITQRDTEKAQSFTEAVITDIYAIRF